MTAGTTPSWPDREPTRSSAQRHMDRWARWGMAALVLFTVSAIVAGWRYFPGFSGDHAWYLQVALRVSQGEVLYRDVAWAYGPLPAQALAALFRWLGPDAAWASLINAALTVTGVLLTYVVTRSVLSGGGAFLVTAFATLVGPNLWGGLFHIYFYTYTQAIAWGAVLSLAALASVLHWQQTRQHSWILLAGLATGLAILSKPEFGLTALGASAVSIAAGRGPAGVWWRYLLTCGLTTGMGFGWQSSSAGWWPVWRGYTGYSQVADRSGSLWGTYLGNKRLLLGSYTFWLAVAALWACRHWPRRRLMVIVLVFLAGLGVLTAVLLGMMGGALPEILRQGASSWRSSIPSMASFLTALPWAPILPLLLGAGWLARKRSLPAAWWGLWAYAVISNLRLLLTGYANGLAVAPALAVFWVWIESQPAAPQDRQRGRRIALAILAGLALFSLVAQVIVPNPLFNQPRVWVDSAVGPLRIAQPFQESYESMAAFIDRTVPVGRPIFAGDYGAQWYLLTQRPNPTAFDVFITGLGISGPEAGNVERALLAQPPAAVILPTSWQLESDTTHRDATTMRQNLPAWWKTLKEDYSDETPPGVRNWRVLVHRSATTQ